MTERLGRKRYLIAATYGDALEFSKRAMWVHCKNRYFDFIDVDLHPVSFSREPRSVDWRKGDEFYVDVQWVKRHPKEASLFIHLIRQLELKQIKVLPYRRGPQRTSQSDAPLILPL